jgi:hypothetical protein
MPILHEASILLRSGGGQSHWSREEYGGEESFPIRENTAMLELKHQLTLCCASEGWCHSLTLLVARLLECTCADCNASYNLQHKQIQPV